MYYYIFDIKKCRKKNIVEDIKNYLSTLGISGEFVYPSAAYNTEELVDLGLSKNYNTIVGIGDEDIANKIAGKLCGRSEAMGMIPIEYSPDLSSLISAKSWKEAADNLRYRKISEIRIGKTANGKSFLTNLQLAIKFPTEITIEFKDYLVQTKVTNLVISNFHKDINKLSPEFLDIVFESVDPKNDTFFNKLSSLFGFSQDSEKNISLFKARSLRLFTSSQIPLVSGDDIVAKTPQLIESSDENLRLIVGKKIL